MDFTCPSCAIALQKIITPKDNSKEEELLYCSICGTTYFKDKEKKNEDNRRHDNVINELVGIYKSD